MRRFGAKGIGTVSRASDSARSGGEQLLLDGRGGLVIVGSYYGGGGTHPAFGCNYRDDLCSADVRLRVWRMDR
jgi:hypothetical protein